MQNYINAFNYRHAERKDVWGLDDEIVEGAIVLIQDIYTDEEVAKRDAVLDYDNLAINAEIIAINDASEDDKFNALFTTDNFVIYQW